LNKIIARASSVALMLLLVSVFCNAATCTGGSSLSGWYGMLVNGTGKYLAGAVYLDGNCNISGSNISGGSGGQYATTSVTGTYGENSDGTFNVTLNLAGQSAAQTYTIGVSESGYKARGVESDGTVAATIDLQSQLTSLTSGYSTASLTGTYAASCLNATVAHLNYVTFDGKGDVTGLDEYDTGTVGSSPYSGSYSVNSDGTFSGSLVGNYSAYSFNGVIDNGVSEIEYIYNDSGSGAVLGCAGKLSPATAPNLVGYYGIVVGGNAQSGGGGKYLSGSVYFNGAGTLTATNLNGGINTTYGNTTATGTYTVNSNNTVSITMNLVSPASTQTYLVAVSEAGDEAVGVETDGTAIATIDMQQQLQLPSASYKNASLVGTYSASCTGAEVDLNYTTFDGNGNITAGVDAYYNGGYGDNPYTGTYTVNSDGTFTGNFVGPIYDVFTMTGVLDNGTAEIEFTYNESGVGGVVACIGESTYGPIGTNTVAATPAFSPEPGAFGSAQTVILSDTTAGAVIHYTTNGVTPTTNSPVYTSGTPIPVSATTTIQAIAVASGYNNSAIAAGTYFLESGLPALPSPSFSPTPGSYSSAQPVTLSSIPGAVIYYTTNGTAPSETSSIYSSPIQVTTTTTIEAMAVASGYSNSAPVSGTYTITAGSGTSVNLSSYYNVYAIAAAGKPAKNGGFDGQSGDAYNSATLGTSATYKGQTFVFGPANAPDGVSSETIALPAGSYASLYLLGAGSYGAQTNQSFVVTYTDGTTSTFTQTLSDWWASQGYPGETVVVSPSNIILSNGAVDAQPVNLYGYTFNLIASKTVASLKLPSDRQTAFLAIGLSAPTGATPITPYIQVNGGSWQQTNTATVSYGSSVNLGPQPLTGTWSWTGPNGYTSTSRQINNIPLSTGTNTYIATYTNSSAVQSTETFTITVTGAPTPIVPYIQVNGGPWQQTASVTAKYGSSVSLGPQPLTGGSWSWTGPNGFTSTSRQINGVADLVGTYDFVATYTNTSGIKSTQTFAITVVR
jgi:hypothetical protein